MYVSTSSSDRETLLRAIRFENPDYIPMTFHINDACWDHYDQNALLDLMEEHPFLFPGFQRPQLPIRPDYDANARAGIPYTDDFGCVWKTSMDGIVGSVLEHPLADISKYSGYRFPDPEKSMGLGPVDWAEFEAQVARQKARGEMTYGDLRHGHTFQQLCDIRGYMDALMDLTDEEPEVLDLLEKLCRFNLAQINHFLKADVDIVRIPEDLGMQIGPMISPALFREYIKPLYQRMLEPVRKAGKIIHMHSDGDIRSLVDDIIEGGVDIINLQDLVNGVDWIGSKFRGKTCVDLDIDRQKITPFGTPAEVEPGTEKGSIIATIGMGVSIVINTLVLSFGVIAGQAILSALPAAVNTALSNYLLPALFGALIVQFGLKAKLHTIVMLAVGCFMYIAVGKSPLGINLFGWLSGASNYLPTLVCVFVSIGIMMVTSKKKVKA